MSKKKLNHPHNNRNKYFNKNDPIFNSWFIKKLINNMPIKHRAKNRKAVFFAMRRVKGLTKTNPLLLFVLMVQHLRPLVWIRVRRFGKKEYRIPYRLDPLKQYKRSIKWISMSILSRNEHNLVDKITNEFVDLLNKKSKVFDWRKNLVSDVIRNLHNADYRW